MTIRRLTETEIDESLALSQFAFQYELPKEELEARKRREKPEQTWGYFSHGRLAAKMTILPLDVFINGHVYAMGGIASVATWPEFRRQGMVKQLLTRGLKVMKEDGQSVSLLHPFSFGYYRRYGWEHTFDYKKYTVQRDQLPHYVDTSGTVVRKLGNDLSLLKQIYEAYAAKFNGTLIRSDEWWQYRSVLKDQKATVAVYYDRAGTPRGYIVYKVKDREMKIDELIHLDETCRRELWRYISNHDSMVEKVTLTAPPDDNLPFLLNEPRIKQDIIPYFMARIVDAKRFLEQYPFQPNGESESCVLHLEDQYAPWNDGMYALQIDGRGRANVTVMKQENVNNRSDTSAGLKCNIQTLSTMLLGYQRPSHLHEIGRLKGAPEDVQRLESLVPQRTPYLLDFF